MITQELYNQLQNATVTKTRDDGTWYIILLENIDSTLKHALTALVLDNSDTFSDFDINYQMLNDAIRSFSYVDYEELYRQGENANIAEYMQDNYNEHASPYNAPRLSYLNNNNEYDIYDILKEYECDSINQACAIWYDNQVNEYIQNIINNIILKDND